MSANIESINNGENILVGDNIEVVNNVSLVEQEKEVEEPAVEAEVEATPEQTEVEVSSEDNAEQEVSEEPAVEEAAFPSIELPQESNEVPTYEPEVPVMPEAPVAPIDLSGLLPSEDVNGYPNVTTSEYGQFDTPSYGNDYNTFNSFNNFDSYSAINAEPSIPEGSRRALDMIENEIIEVYAENKDLKRKNEELEAKIAELNVNMDNLKSENATLKTKISENANQMDLSRQRVLDFFGMNAMASNPGNVQYTASDNNMNVGGYNGGMAA